VGNYCYVASARRHARRWGAHGGRRGAVAYHVAMRTACYNIVIIVQEFSELWPKLDAVFDAGRLSSSAQNKTGSTVVDLSKCGQFTIIRDGW